MKTKLLLLAMMLCFLITPLSCYAAETPADISVSSSVIMLDNGYTEDGVYYEVFGEPLTVNPGVRAYLDVERTVVYVGEVFPPQTMTWSEKIGNYVWTGTLDLDYFIYNASTNRTTAYYEGTLSNN